MSDVRFELKAVGSVIADQKGFALQIDEPFRAALTGLEGFSHINVLWWCHLLDAPAYRETVLTERPYRGRATQTISSPPSESGVPSKSP